MFAYNYSGDPVTARFAFPAPLTKAVVVNAEETTCGGVPCARTITPDAAGGFTDTFAPYQAHVYVLESEAPTAVITSPVEGAKVGRSVAVKASVSVPGTYSYHYTVDGTLVTETTSSGFTWNTKSLASGSHLLVLTVKDPSGAIVARATRTVVK